MLNVFKKRLVRLVLFPTASKFPGIHSHWNSAGKTLESEVEHYLQRKKIKHKKGEACVLCMNVFQQGTKTENNGLTCYINKTSGHFYCVDTEYSGSWDVFKKLFSLSEKKQWQEYKEVLDATITSSSTTESSVMLDWKMKSKSLFDAEHSNLNGLLKKCGLNIFTYEFLHNNQIRADMKETSLLHPWFKWKNCTQAKIIGIETLAEYCSLNQDRMVKPSISSMETYYSSSYFGTLGVKFPNDCSLVIALNVYDVLSINYKSLKYRAICLPFGSSHLPLNTLPFLEGFSKLVIWFGNSPSDMEASKRFAKKLGVDRCKIVKPRSVFMTPYQALKGGMDLDQIIDTATSMNIKNIIKFEDIRYDVRNQIENKTLYAGVPWKRFEKLTKKLKGHRRGELTIVTGTTGCGKTTLVSELSLDLAIQGVTTLWGSFEINNTRLMKGMLQQFSKVELEQNIDKFNEVADKFKMLPLHMMTFNGPQNIDVVLETMYQGTFANDIQHVIIDNLQFMLGSQHLKMDKFAHQDYVIGEFRKFATKEQVHVTVVIHPRKEDSNMPLQISSVFGSAKATQEADNVLILQSYKSNSNQYYKKYLEICKNRFDGDVGNIALYFDRRTLCMSPAEKIEKISNTVETDHESSDVPIQRNCNAQSPTFSSWKDQWIRDSH